MFAYCGNNGEDPSNPLGHNPTIFQLRPEYILCEAPTSDRTEPLPEKKILEEKGDFPLTEWFEAMERLMIKDGQDVCLWVQTGTGATKKHLHIYRNHHQLTETDVAEWERQLTNRGLIGDVYDRENLTQGGQRILDSIGPKLRSKILKGGTSALTGLMALHRILSEFKSEELTEIDSIVASFEKMSLSSSATQDVTSLATDITTQLNKLMDISKTVIVEQNIGGKIAKIFYCNDQFYKDTLVAILQAPIMEFYIDTRTKRLTYEQLVGTLNKLSQLHRTFCKRDDFLPAKNKPTKQDQQIASLLAANKKLSADVVTLQGQVQGRSGGGDKTKQEQSNGSGRGNGNSRNRRGGRGSGHNNNDNKAAGGSNNQGNDQDNNRRQQNAWKTVRDNPNEWTKTVGGKTYYWCTKCNGGKGMWALLHGDQHPSEKHNDDFQSKQRERSKANQQQGSSGSGSTGSGGAAALAATDLTADGGMFDLPLGMFFGAIDYDTVDSVHPKVCGGRRR